MHRRIVRGGALLSVRRKWLPGRVFSFLFFFLILLASLGYADAGSFTHYEEGISLPGYPLVIPVAHAGPKTLGIHVSEPLDKPGRAEVSRYIVNLREPVDVAGWGKAVSAMNELETSKLRGDLRRFLQDEIGREKIRYSYQYIYSFSAELSDDEVAFLRSLGVVESIEEDVMVYTFLKVGDGGGSLNVVNVPHVSGF